MKKLSRYIFRKCVFNTFLILTAFIVLFSIFNILGEIANVGKGSFTTGSLFYYTFLLIPNYIYLLMPLAVLIGVMISMLGLVNYSEYAIIRTSGFSLKHITLILSAFGITFSLITFLMGEIVAPRSNHYAQVYKITKTRSVMTTQLRSGIWSKDGDNSFVNIKQVLPDNSIIGVNLFNYDRNLALLSYISADHGNFNESKQAWDLYDVTVYDYTSQNIQIKHLNEYLWKSSVVPSYFSVLVIAPEDMSAFGLIKYIHHLKENNQSTQRYQIAFWSKLLYPISCISMALIALAFIPNNRRNINLGTKLFAGILIGVAFFFTTRMISFMALLFNWNAILSALLPTAILFTLGWYFVLRKE